MDKNNIMNRSKEIELLKKERSVRPSNGQVQCWLTLWYANIPHRSPMSLLHSTCYHFNNSCGNYKKVLVKVIKVLIRVK